MITSNRAYTHDLSSIPRRSLDLLEPSGDGATQVHKRSVGAATNVDRIQFTLLIGLVAVVLAGCNQTAAHSPDNASSPPMGAVLTDPSQNPGAPPRVGTPTEVTDAAQSPQPSEGGGGAPSQVDPADAGVAADVGGTGGAHGQNGAMNGGMDASTGAGPSNGTGTRHQPSSAGPPDAGTGSGRNPGGSGRGNQLPAGVSAPNSRCTAYNRDGYTCSFRGTHYFWNASWDCNGGCLEYLSSNSTGATQSTLPSGVYGPNAVCTPYNQDGYTCNFSGTRYFWNAWWDCNGGCLEYLPNAAQSGLPSGVYGASAACTPYNSEGYTCNFAGEQYIWDAYWDCNGGCLEYVSSGDPTQDYPPPDYPPQDYPPQDYPPQDYPPQDYPPPDTTYPSDPPPPVCYVDDFGDYVCN